MQLDPYDAELYRLSTRIYLTLNKMQDACEVAAKGSQRFPQDDGMRTLMKRCDAAVVGPDK
jgi:hypothetical protein